MFYSAITILFLLPILLGFGEIFTKFFGKLGKGYALKMFCGIILLSLVCTGFSFIIPLNINAEIASICIGYLAFFYSSWPNLSYRISIRKIWFFIPFALVILLFSSFHPYIADHFGYFVPTVKWISEIGMVKGIANLDLILGQMSVWHVLQACFSHFSDSFLRINVVAIFIYLIYIFEKKSWIQLAFIPVLLLLIQSPTPDLPVIAFSLMILTEILNKNPKLTLLMFASTFIVVLKPTAIWLPIFVFSYGFLILKSKLYFIIPATILIGLFFLKNIWTFGFPVFPMQIVDFGLPWSPNPEILKTSAQLALEKTFDQNYTYAEIQKFSKFEWVKNWFTIPGIKSKINILFLLSLGGLSIFSFIKKQKIIFLILISLVSKSVLIIAFSAQYRFFLDVFFVVPLVIFQANFSKKMGILAFFGLSALLSIFFLKPKLVQEYFPSFRLGRFIGKFGREQLYKPGTYDYQKYQQYTIGNLTFNVVSNYPFSFDTPLPAISPSFLKEYSDAGIFPQKAGKSLKEGFIWRKLTLEEQKEIIKIIEKTQPPKHDQ